VTEYPYTDRTIDRAKDRGRFLRFDERLEHDERMRAPLELLGDLVERLQPDAVAAL
jgi:hypothetical protein